MQIQDIKEAQIARPFVPFVIGIADGTTVAVQHPENLFLTPTMAHVIEWNEARTEHRSHLLGYAMIARVSFLPELSHRPPA